jgi:hypothetical protein
MLPIEHSECYAFHQICAFRLPSACNGSDDGLTRFVLYVGVWLWLLRTGDGERLKVKGVEATDPTAASTAGGSSVASILSVVTLWKSHSTNVSTDTKTPTHMSGRQCAANSRWGNPRQKDSHRRVRGQKSGSSPAAWAIDRSPIFTRDNIEM